jgi:hypothetical protein
MRDAAQVNSKDINEAACRGTLASLNGRRSVSRFKQCCANPSACHRPIFKKIDKLSSSRMPRHGTASRQNLVYCKASVSSGRRFHGASSSFIRRERPG